MNLMRLPNIDTMNRKKFHELESMSDIEIIETVLSADKDELNNIRGENFMAWDVAEKLYINQLSPTDTERNLFEIYYFQYFCKYSYVLEQRILKKFKYKRLKDIRLD